MKNKLSKLINIFLIIIMLFSHSLGVLASADRENNSENISMPSNTQEKIINDNEQNINSNLDTQIEENLNEEVIEKDKREQDLKNKQVPEETNQNLIKEQIRLSEEDKKLIEKSIDVNPETEINRDIYHITNTRRAYIPDAPKSLKAKVKVNKQIDYLGDKVKNPDTDIQNDHGYKEEIEDIYRLYLDVEGERLKKQEPIDLLFVLDGSSSMLKKDMQGTGGRAISRRVAVLQMLNETDLVRNFLDQNPENRVAFLCFGGKFVGEKTKKRDGYNYKKDAYSIKKWSHRFNNISFNIQLGMGTNYQAGLMLAEDLINESKKAGRRQAMIFISDGVPTFYINNEGDRIGGGSLLPQNVKNSKKGTIKYLDGFFQRHPNLTTHAVGVSKDINQ